MTSAGTNTIKTSRATEKISSGYLSSSTTAPLYEVVMHYLATKTLLLCTLLQWGLVLSSGNETTSPHFLFMKELRKYLSTAEIVLPSTQEYRPTNEEGKLIARSIEGTNSRGKGKLNIYFITEVGYCNYMQY